jgi:tRNA(Ile)-lysidine synthase
VREDARKDPRELALAQPTADRVRLAANRPRHAVKKLLQQASLTVWQRQALPLVWCGDALAAVPGVGVDVAFQAAAGEKGLRLIWRPTP